MERGARVEGHPDVLGVKEGVIGYEDRADWWEWEDSLGGGSGTFLSHQVLAMTARFRLMQRSLILQTCKRFET